MKTKLIILSLLTIFITSCNPNKKPKNFDYGHTENNKYHNSFFELELILPDNWVVQTKEQMENLSEAGKEIAVGDNKKLEAIINATEINTANLLAVFQYEVGAAVEYNPSFMLVAENLKNAPGVKTGRDYLVQARKLLKQSQVQYQIDDKFKKVTINNHNFYVMNCSINYMGLTIKQKYYSTLKNGFCLSAIISYNNEEQKKNLEKIIHSANFKK